MRRRTLVAVVAVLASLLGGAFLVTGTGSPAGSAGSAGSGGPAGSAGTTTSSVASLAGTGHPGGAGDGGPAGRAQLDAPSGVAVDGSGVVFVADTGNCRVRAVPARTGVLFGKHVTAGEIVTVAGGACGSAHPEPTTLATDASGDLYVDYATAARIDEVTAGRVALNGASVRPGSSVTVAGTGTSGAGGDGGPATAAQFSLPSGIAVDPSGDLLVADTGNCRLRMVAASNGVHDGITMVRGEIATVAGTGVCGSAGDGGPALDAQLWDPGALAVDPSGDVLVADQGNRTVRELAASSGTFFGVPLAAGSLGTVAGEGSYGPYLLDGLPAAGQTGELNFPSGLALGPGGGFYVSDGAMHAIRFVADAPATLLGSSVGAGAMVTVAGARPSGSLSNQLTWVRARMSVPLGLAVTPGGNLVYADAGAHVVRVIRGAGG